MIELQISKEDFVYDIQAICKSFYPSETITQTAWRNEKEGSLDADMVIKVELLEESVLVTAGNGRTWLEQSGNASYQNRRKYKNILKKSLYSVLSELTGKQLPWGTLSGVRPSKLVMELLEKGATKEEVDQYMKEQYLCSQEKIDLGYTIAKKEWNILKSIDYTKGYSLYIGIPFCPTKCSYCSFTSYPMERFGQWMEEYLQALFREMEYVASKPWKRKLTSIYIGGGTPTTLSEEQLRRLLRKVKELFTMEHVVEFTVEAGRPDTITYEKLKVLKEEGADRISINPQTMNQSTLDYIGRKHTVEDIENAFQMARKAGHQNINMDLIVGLPGEDEEAVKTTLNRIEQLNPESLTVHSLVIKRAATLNENLEQEEERLTGDTKNMMMVAEKYAKTHGYEPYYMYRQKNATGMDQDSQENLGYAKPGKECIYNILIMEEKQSILALGAGASSKFLLPNGKKKIERVENVKSVLDYIQRIEEMRNRKEQFLEIHKGELLRS